MATPPGAGAAGSVGAGAADGAALPVCSVEEVRPAPPAIDPRAASNEAVKEPRAGAGPLAFAPAAAAVRCAEGGCADAKSVEDRTSPAERVAWVITVAA